MATKQISVNKKCNGGITNSKGYHHNPIALAPNVTGWNTKHKINLLAQSRPTTFLLRSTHIQSSMWGENIDIQILAMIPKPNITLHVILESCDISKSVIIVIIFYEYDFKRYKRKVSKKNRILLFRDAVVILNHFFLLLTELWKLNWFYIWFFKWNIFHQVKFIKN